MNYPSRTQAIREYLRKNEELIEDISKGKIEINFAGKRLNIKMTEFQDEIEIQTVENPINEAT